MVCLFIAEWVNSLSACCLCLIIQQWPVCSLTLINLLVSAIPEEGASSVNIINTWLKWLRAWSRNTIRSQSFHLVFQPSMIFVESSNFTLGLKLIVVTLSLSLHLPLLNENGFSRSDNSFRLIDLYLGAGFYGIKLRTLCSERCSICFNIPFMLSNISIVRQHSIRCLT